jgi:hypothetical protein
MIKAAEQDSTNIKRNTAAIAVALDLRLFILSAPFTNLRMNFIFAIIIIAHF